MQLSWNNFIPHIYYYAQSILSLQRDPLGVPLLFVMSKRQKHNPTRIQQNAEHKLDKRPANVVASPTCPPPIAAHDLEKPLRAWIALTVTPFVLRAILDENSPAVKAFAAHALRLFDKPNEAKISHHRCGVP